MDSSSNDLVLACNRFLHAHAHSYVHAYTHAHSHEGAHLCRIYQLSADDLHNKWESFTFAMQSAEGGDGVAAVGEDERGADGSIPLNATWFEKFKQHLQVGTAGQHNLITARTYRLCLLKLLE